MPLTIKREVGDVRGVEVQEERRSDVFVGAILLDVDEPTCVVEDVSVPAL